MFNFCFWLNFWRFLLPISVSYSKLYHSLGILLTIAFCCRGFEMNPMWRLGFDICQVTLGKSHSLSEPQFPVQNWEYLCLHTSIKCWRLNDIQMLCKVWYTCFSNIIPYGVECCFFLHFLHIGVIMSIFVKHKLIRTHPILEIKYDLLFGFIVCNQRELGFQEDLNGNKK